MSKYTTQVRYICESLSGLKESKDYTEVDRIISTAEPFIFDGYPLYDDKYRQILNCKILKHFYTREICEETYGLWKLRLNTKMNEIMPYYNQLYKSAMLEFNPLYDTNIEIKKRNDNSRNETGVGNTQNSSNTSGYSQSNQTSNNTQYDYFSDTPQGQLTEVLENHKYLTTADKNTSSSQTNDSTNSTANSSGTSTYSNNIKSNTIDDYIETITGKRGTTSFNNLLKEFRQNMLNIDMMIIDELKTLFFNLW